MGGDGCQQVEEVKDYADAGVRIDTKGDKSGEGIARKLRV